MFLLIFAFSCIAVGGKAAPANDNFANRIFLSGLPVVTTGSNASATREPGDPTTIAGGVCNATVWYNWTAPSNGQYAAVLIMRQPALPLIDVYIKATNGAFTQVIEYNKRESYPVVRNGTNCNAFQVIFDATAGANYQIFTGAEYPYEQEFELVISTPPHIENFSPSTGSDFQPGSNIPLSASATDSDGSIESVRYSIRFGAAITAATNPPYSGTWSNVAVGRYFLVARAVDDLGASSTAINEITVGRPPNDDFADRIVLTGSPVSTVGTILASSLEPGESSSIGIYTSTKTVWWSWVAPISARFAAVAFATNSLTLGVYTGTTMPGLALTAYNYSSHVAQMNGKSQICSQAEWDAIAGTTYHFCINSGHTDLNEVGLSITQPPQVELITPADGTVLPNASNIAITTTPSDPDGAIQRVDLYEIHIFPNHGYTTLVATLTNSPWSINWNTATIGNYPLGVRVVDDFGAATSKSNRIWVAVSRPPNDDFAQRIILPNFQKNITVRGSNRRATGEKPWEHHGISSIWWSWTAPASGPITIDTCGSYNNAYLQVYLGASAPNLVLWGYASGLPCDELSFDAVAGTTYHIAVEGGWSQGDVTLNLSGTIASPVPLVGTTRSPDGKLRFQTTGVPGQNSVLEISTDLVHWSPIITNSYNGGLIEFEAPIASNTGHQFYRVQQK